MTTAITVTAVTTAMTTRRASTTRRISTTRISPDLRDRQFLGASGSVGLLADIGDDSAFVASLRHAHRVPAPQKPFNFGPHLGNYEVGSPGLEPEVTRDSISASGARSVDGFPASVVRREVLL